MTTKPEQMDTFVRMLSRWLQAEARLLQEIAEHGVRVRHDFGQVLLAGVSPIGDTPATGTG